jgi:hypothetical protein
MSGGGDRLPVSPIVNAASRSRLTYPPSPSRRKWTELPSQLHPEPEAARGIHRAHLDSGAAYGRDADDIWRIEAEVITPLLRSRIEEQDDFSGFFVHS